MATDGQWRVSVSSDCIGSGVCAGTAPKHFRLVGGYSEPIAVEVEPDEAVLGAAESCPTHTSNCSGSTTHFFSAGLQNWSSSFPSVK